VDRLPRRGWIVLGALVVLGLAFVPAAWRLNTASLRALWVCAGTAERTAPSLEVRTALVTAGAARCAGDSELEQVSLQQALAGKPAWLQVVRAAAPQNRSLAEAAVLAQPENPHAFFWLGDVLRMEGSTGLAVLEYRAGLQLDPEAADPWYWLGRLEEEAGNWQAAVGAYSQACVYQDSGKNGCVNAARLYFDHQDFELALARYRTALAQLPGYPPALRGAAESLLALGRAAEAVPYLQSLAEQGDPDARQQLDTMEEQAP
jgi:tetratricopeptide (TPR) repeat protein